MNIMSPVYMYMQWFELVRFDRWWSGAGGTVGGVRNRCLYLLSLLEPSRRDGVALLVLQQLLWRLEELVADVALEHARDEVNLKVPLVHAACLAHKVAEDALKACGEEREEEETVRQKERRV